MIGDFAKLIPEALWGRSGAAFHSGKRAFERPSAPYILGTNPGGDPQDQADETVSSNARRVLHDASGNWSAYRDESWKGRSRGAAPMQRRVLHMIRKLDLNPGEVPASNLVFVRSRIESRLEGDFARLAQACWPFHKAVLAALRVRVILCLGRTPGGWVRDELRAREQVDEFVEHNERKWKSRAFTNAAGLAVVVATHPGRADWTTPATDPTGLVQRALSGSYGRRTCRVWS